MQIDHGKQQIDWISLSIRANSHAGILQLKWFAMVTLRYCVLTESLAGTYRVPPAQGRGSGDPLGPGALEWGPSGQKRKKRQKRKRKKEYHVFTSEGRHKQKS